MRNLLAGLVGVCLGSIGTSAHSAVVIDVQQVGSDVIATTSGSLNLDGLVSFGDNFGVPRFRSDSAIFYTSFGPADVYGLVAGPSNFGAGFITILGDGSGSTFGIAPNVVSVPEGYISHGSLFATTTFKSLTFANLGLNLGTYVFKTPSDTITVNIGSTIAAVPEPATWIMMMLGMGGIGFTMRRKKDTTLRVRFA